MRVDWCVCVVVVSYLEYSLTLSHVVFSLPATLPRARITPRRIRARARRPTLTPQRRATWQTFGGPRLNRAASGLYSGVSRKVRKRFPSRFRRPERLACAHGARREGWEGVVRAEEKRRV